MIIITNRLRILDRSASATNVGAPTMREIHFAMVVSSERWALADTAVSGTR